MKANRPIETDLRKQASPACSAAHGRRSAFRASGGNEWRELWSCRASIAAAETLWRTPRAQRGAWTVKVFTLAGIEPCALRRARAEKLMSVTLFRAWEVGSDQAAPRCAPLRSAPGRAYAARVCTMQASGPVGRMSYGSTLHCRPNPPFNRSAKRRCRSVPVALCPPAPG